jgi:hypothetical protein
MLIDNCPNELLSLHKERNVSSETNVSQLTERGQVFPIGVAYKHLAPNGAKTPTSKTR